MKKLPKKPTKQVIEYYNNLKTILDMEFYNHFKNKEQRVFKELILEHKGLPMKMPFSIIEFYGIDVSINNINFALITSIDYNIRELLYHFVLVRDEDKRETHSILNTDILECESFFKKYKGLLYQNKIQNVKNSNVGFTYMSSRIDSVYNMFNQAHSEYKLRRL